MFFYKIKCILVRGGKRFIFYGFNGVDVLYKYKYIFEIIIVVIYNNI